MKLCEKPKMVSTRQGTTKFSLGETVLCYEPDETKAKVLYESKILEIDFTKDEKGKRIPEYFVHFSGWNKSWDRWVLEDQIVAGTEDNRQKMKRLREEAVNRLKNKRKRKTALSNVDTSQLDTSSASLPTAPPQLQSPNSPSAPSIDLEIPCPLKLKLEDDCYFIKRKKKLVCLPRSPNVIDILKEYIAHVTLLESQQPEPDTRSNVKIVKEVMDGLRVYFDFTLSSLLLYNMERDEHEKVMGDVTIMRKNETDQKKKNQKEESGKQKLDEKLGSIEKQSKEKSETKQSVKSESPAEKSTDECKEDQPSGRVLRRRSKRQSISSVSSTQSLTVSADTKSSTKQGTKRKFLPAVVREEEDSANTTTSESPCISPSQVYGIEHLLRLFVRLPSLLAKTTIDEKRLPLLLHHLTKFLSYLSTRINTLTSEDVYRDSAVL